MTTAPFRPRCRPAKTAPIQFQVIVGSNPGPIVCNTARLGFGGAASGKQATDCDLVAGNNHLKRLCV